MSETTCNLRQIRRSLDWTIIDLAERSGIQKNTISELERGAKARLGVMIAISNACSIDIRDIWPDCKCAVPLELENAAGAANRLESVVRCKIVRNRRQGDRIWRIALDTGVSVYAIMIVLIEQGELLSVLNRRAELVRPNERAAIIAAI